VAVESHGPLSDTTASFLGELGHKITDHSGDPLKAQFLFQRVSVLIQQFNCILLRETVQDEDDRYVAIPTCFNVFNIFAFNHQNPYYWGYKKIIIIGYRTSRCSSQGWFEKASRYCDTAQIPYGWAFAMFTTTHACQSCNYMEWQAKKAYR